MITGSAEMQLASNKNTLKQKGNFPRPFKTWIRPPPPDRNAPSNAGLYY